MVPAVSRALTLLDRLAARREPMSLARLSTDLALPKSSVHGLCNTLMSFGYLRRQTDGAFLIGPRVLSLAEAFVAGTGVAQEFNALWQDAAAPEETLVLTVLDGAEAVYVGVRHGSRPLGLAFNVGMRLPAHLAASGKAMLAFHPPETVRRLYAEGLPPSQFARGATLTPAALKRDLAATRERGYSIDDEGVRAGVYAVGAPVFGAAGMPVAGIAVCLNKAEVRPASLRRHRQAVLAAAATLTERLGGLPSAARRAPAPAARPVRSARPAASSAGRTATKERSA